MAGSTKRIAHGRGHRYVLDGEAAQGVTRVTGDGISKPGLVRWAARSVAGYAIDHWDELLDMKASERLRVLENAAWAERDEAAGRGRDVHALVEQLQAGEEVDVPEPLTGHVDAYLQFDRDWKPEEILVETVVVSRSCRYMGTLDVVARLRDGDLWLLDWKTGGSGVWPEVALQLAAYRYADTYLDTDGVEHDMVQVDRCGALWLRSDGYDLYPVDAGLDQFRRFQYAQVLAAFVNEPRETLIGEALTPPPVVEAA